MSCLVLGDSIAVGIGSILKHCTVIAKVGMTSGWIFSHTPAGHFDTTVLSAGTNDWANHYIHVHDNIEKIERRNPSKYVLILPHNKDAALIVAQSAGRPIAFIAGPDHTHPKSYKQVVKDIGKV